MFRFKKKPVVKHTQPTVSKKEKLLVIWDELDDDEKDDYKSVMTEDEWLDFKYELVKRQRTNKSNRLKPGQAISLGAGKAWRILRKLC